MAAKKKKTAKRSPSKRKPPAVPPASGPTMHSVAQAITEGATPGPPLSAKDIPSGGGVLGIPMVLAEHDDKIEALEKELAEIKTKFEKMEKMFYLPGSEGGADAV